MPQSRKTFKIKLFLYIQNNGDGSASARFMAGEALAEKLAEKSNERLCDDIQTHELEVDAETGEIVTGVETTVEND